MGERGKTIGGLRNCRLKLCRSPAVVRQAAPGGSDRVAGPQETPAFIGGQPDSGIAACDRGGRGQLTGRSAQRSRGGMADAYGSGPYGATRGGSTPLVSSACPFFCTFAEYLSTFFGLQKGQKPDVDRVEKAASEKGGSEYFSDFFETSSCGSRRNRCDASFPSGISVFPGTGSAAGSEVARCLPRVKPDETPMKGPIQITVVGQTPQILAGGLGFRCLF